MFKFTLYLLSKEADIKENSAVIFIQILHLMYQISFAKILKKLKKILNSKKFFFSQTYSVLEE